MGNPLTDTRMLHIIQEHARKPLDRLTGTVVEMDKRLASHITQSDGDRQDIAEVRSTVYGNSHEGLKTTVVLNKDRLNSRTLWVAGTLSALWAAVIWLGAKVLGVIR